MPKDLIWTPELVDRFWTGIAKSRLSELNFSRHNGEFLLDIVADRLKPNARCLDFGAGQGELLSRLLDRGLQVAAYDPVGERISMLPAALRDRDGFLGVVGPESDERFDVVFMVEVIEHVLEDELHATLEGLAALVHEGGILVLTTPNSEDLELSSAYCPGCESLFHRWQHQRSFTPDSLTALLDRYGFACENVHQIDFTNQRFLVEELDELRQEVRQLRRALKRPFWSRLVQLARRLSLRRKRAEARRVPEPDENRFVGDGSTLVYIGRRDGRAAS